MNSHKQQGTAIVIALFVVALVSAITMAMIEHLRIDTRRTELLLNRNKMELLANSSVDWAMQQLIQNWEQKKSGQLIDKLPARPPVNEQNGIKIISILYDAQSFFNLNNLTDPEYQEAFTRLIQLIDPSISTGNAEEITYAVRDWIQEGANNTAFDQYYAKLKIPYRSSHHPMASKSELRLIKGISNKLYNQLLPYLITLPSKTPVNINTTSTQILACLSNSMTLQAAKSLWDLIRINPFPDTAHFMGYDIVKNNGIKENKITVTSEYFLLETHAKLGSQSMTMFTLLKRISKNASAKVAIIWQTKGTL